jgi:hypothetical protein
MECKIYKTFISSPRDTAIEREICDQVFDEINRGLGSRFKFRIESLKWERDTSPSFGEEVQTVIDSQLGNHYQIFIGIMHSTFGTPTNRAGSGTEEEFNHAYSRLLDKENIEILFYFGEEPPKKLSEVNTQELEKINAFKRKVSDKGGLYGTYNGPREFEEKLRKDITKYFLQIYQERELSRSSNVESTEKFDAIAKLFQRRLTDALSMFNGQPIIWVDPMLSSTNDISINPDENYENRVDLEELIGNSISYFIKAPPEFGLTSLAHFMIVKAWKRNKFWVYLDSQKFKPHNIQNAVKNETEAIGMKLADVDCIILDSWNSNDPSAFKKLKNLCDGFANLRIIVMQTIDDNKFFQEINEDGLEIEREFSLLHLLALSRRQIREIVSGYNKIKGIGEDEVVLAKITLDLEALNIHRTPQNCLTLLTVSEKHFDESPVNRTKMLEMVLFILFDMGTIPTYKTRPDLKDCEYVLGRFCENLVRGSSYHFSRELFLRELKKFCDEKLIDLEVEVVFDVLHSNNIIVKLDFDYVFRCSFWIFYFAAKRMHVDDAFMNYIFDSKKYIQFPEIIEFYTGIDRNRANALRALHSDLKIVCDVVFNSIGMPDNFNPFANAQWNPSEEHLQKIHEEIGENVLNSRLPDSVKDQYADNAYNQIRPYNQSINGIFEKYSLHTMIQSVKASSRALRNSDYVEPSIKKEILKEILRGWEQLSKVLFALSPMLASTGSADFDDTRFMVIGDMNGTYEQALKKLLIANSLNVLLQFKDDLYSNKLGPLLFDQFSTEQDGLKKHHLAFVIVHQRPRQWKKIIEGYIIALPKNSFFLYDIVQALRSQYRYSFANSESLREIEYLIKMGLAKHHYGEKKPGLDKIMKIPNTNLPKRQPERE